MFEFMRAELQKLKDEFGPFLRDVCQFVKVAAPEAAMIGSLIGQPEVTLAAGAATIIADAVDKEIVKNATAGHTTESLASSGVAIMQAVAVAIPETAPKINEMLARVDPNIMLGLAGG